MLRSRRLSGYKFHRQKRIGRYVADFCCFRPRLIVELDGGQHAEQIEYDQRRTDFLKNEGFQVIRFWDIQVLKEIDSVMEAILTALTETAPSPPPSPTLGRGSL